MEQINSETLTGQVVKVQTTADECIRLTIDIDSQFVGEVNVLKWKNEMVEITKETKSEVREVICQNTNI